MQGQHRAATAQQASTARRSVLWRIHFWAALIASPFTLVAALTGILYIFTPQIESVRYGWLDHVEATGAMRPLDDAVAAAAAAASAGWHLESVLPPHGARNTVKVAFTSHQPPPPGHAVHHHATGPVQTMAVYVNPYTARVISRIVNEERFGAWSKRLHSRLLQGDGWRWMIELAAGAMLVMLLSGIVLWWTTAAGQRVPKARSRGRIAWKQWHAFLGLVLSVVTFTILVTGLTWSKYAGGQIRTVRDALGQASPQVPRDLVSIVTAGASPLSAQDVWTAVRKVAPDVAMQLTAPRNEQAVWRIASADPGQPRKRYDLLLDAYSGKVLYFSGWDQQTAFGKATAIGIPFHRGEFGVWNQAVLLLFGAGVLFSLISGWVMYFKRRRPGIPALPRVQAGAWRMAAATLAGPTILLCALTPVLAVAASVVLLLELLIPRMAPGVMALPTGGD